jgi:hypothetical protein
MAYGYNYFRDYDPALGRYIQSDPIGLKGGLNTYGYVEGNPPAKKDPEGLTAAVLGGLGGSGAAAGGVGAVLGGAAALGGAGALGYGVGTFIYPGLEPGLSRGIDWICNALGPPRTERCNTAFQNCKGWRKDKDWIDRCGRALEQCVRTNLPVLFPNGDIVK